MDPIDVRQLPGRELVGGDGRPLGRIGGVVVAERTGTPDWVAVTTGAGTRLVPLAQARVHGDHVHVPYGATQVAGAEARGGGRLSPADEHRLYGHFGFRWSDDASSAPPADEATTTVMEPASTATAAEVVRSEEELAIGVERQEAGRARLRKEVVTETVTHTVPVRREVLRIEREPIAEGTVPAGGPLAEQELEVVLHRERPVVEKEVVATERVRLAKDTYVEHETVQAEVRKERIEADDDLRAP